MLNSVRGVLTHKGSDFIHLESGFLEWQITMPTSAISPLKLGEEMKIFTFLQHKEDAMTLFGFGSIAQRELFMSLVKVDGIGPKAAIRILSHFSTESFIEALNAPTIDLLAKAPGLGTKTAQKVMLALKGKLHLDEETQAVSQVETQDDLLAGLVNMGFERKATLTALTKLRKELGSDVDEATLLRKVIAHLS